MIVFIGRDTLIAVQGTGIEGPTMFGIACGPLLKMAFRTRPTLLLFREKQHQGII
jgi:hypothetical protein